jgi:hypothetical protein
VEALWSLRFERFSKKLRDFVKNLLLIHLAKITTMQGGLKHRSITTKGIELFDSSVI